MMRRRILLGGVAGFGAWLGGAAQAQTARFLALRHWVSPEYTRLALEFDGVLLIDERSDVASASLKSGSPNAYELELVGLAFIPALQTQLTQTFKAGDTPALLLETRAAPMQNGLRLSLQFSQAAKVEVTTVAATSAYRQRLLIDIYPAQSDPIAAWLAAQKKFEPKQPNSPQAQNPSASTSSSPNLNAPPSSPASGQKPVRLKTVVIDAGHGGEDPGAVGPSGVKEKDITLALALQLAAKVRLLDGWQAVLTRDADYFVPLAQRVKKARAAQADVFLSIHADAFFTPKARGASVYALSEKGASSAAAKWMASRENEADGVGGLNVGHRDKQVASVMLDLSTASQIRRSLKLGAGVLKQLGGVGVLHKRQVEQAGFAVLKAPDVPSILVETAFISHPEEEQLLLNAAYQARLVAALARGLSGFS